MITKTIKSYPLLNRLAALPLLTVLLLCFSFRYHPAQPLLKRSFTVVLDAGHGGEDKGAQAEGLRESDLSLDFAKLIQEDLSKKGINVVMTRTNDQTIKLGDRVALAGTANANLFVSVHLNAGTEHSPEPHGFEVVLPFRNTKFEKQNLNLSMELSARMQKIFDQPVIVKKPKQGVYVLDQNPYCPAVLLECGYMTHAGDRAILQDAEKKNEIAANIAESIAAYLSNLK